MIFQLRYGFFCLLQRSLEDRIPSTCYGEQNPYYSNFGVQEAYNDLDKPFACSYCQYRTFYKGDLMKHNRIHTGERPYKCDYCSYSSAVTSNLIKHIRIHSNDKPYKCSYCKYTAAQKRSLHIHIQKHHN